MFENDNENQYQNSYGNFSGAYSSSNTSNTTNSFEHYSSDGSPKKPDKKNKKGDFGKKIASAVSLGLVFGLCAGTAFSVPAYYANKELKSSIETATALQSSASAASTQSAAATPSISTTTEDITASSYVTTSTTSIESIANSCLPSVVSITNKGVSEVRTYFGTYTQDTSSSGSGIIIAENDDELLIVTNYHVISGAKELTVIFSYDEDSENPQAVSANVKGYDEDKDLAVIYVSKTDLTDEMKSQIKIATVGDSSELQLGEQVVAIGNALGYGQSVTTGIISALNREVTVENDNGTAITNKLIQTDAAINPGNSGGALINMKGELVGINSVKVANSSVEGMGYAIPISDVSDIISELVVRQTRTVVDSSERGYLGIKGGQDVSSSISEAYGIPVGVYISSVYAGSPAEKAGLQKGYIITKFDGQSVKTLSELQNLIAYYKAGETVEVVGYVQSSEGYVEKTFTLTLGSSSIFGDDAANLNGSSSQSNSDNQQTPDNGSSNGNGNSGNSGYGYYYGNGNGNSDNSGNSGSSGFNFFWPFGNN